MSSDRTKTYQLISNSQWLAIAKLIANTPQNWIGPLVNGWNTDSTMIFATGYVLKFGKIGLPANRAPDSDSDSKENAPTVYHRNFIIPGGVIYDFAGNAAEWIMMSSDNAEISNAQILADQPQLAYEFGSSLEKQTGAQAEAAEDFFPLDKKKYACGESNPFYQCGLGKINLTPASTVNTSDFQKYALIRGGKGSTQRKESNHVGILTTEVVSREIKDSFIGFRCVYNSD